MSSQVGGLTLVNGGAARPNYRARVVEKELITGVDPTLYAATPPLGALKLLLACACFHAMATRELFVEFPCEDPDFDDEECVVGRLRLAFDGTRDAALL